MNVLIAEMEKELKRITALLHRVRQSLAKAPEGVIYVQKEKGYIQYVISKPFKRLDLEYNVEVKYRNRSRIRATFEKALKTCDIQGEPVVVKYYASKKRDKIEISRFLQKRYNTKMLEILCRIQETLEHSLTILKENTIDNEYLTLEKDIQEMIIPICPTLDIQINEWNQQIELRGEDATHREMTIRGDYVISKSEKIIADRLYQLGIPYHYEKSLMVGNKVVKPDFTILSLKTGQTIYWEHYGMIGNEEYGEGFVWKKNQYLLNGIVEGENLITTVESKSIPLRVETIECLIKKYLI